jgi:hypothetical protein
VESTALVLQALHDSTERRSTCAPENGVPSGAATIPETMAPLVVSVITPAVWSEEQASQINAATIQ